MTASFEDFQKLDLRIGKILKVEDHPQADKLYVLTVGFGDEERTIVAGIKAYYEKHELENKKAVFITNLKPIKLRGIESNGMLIAAGSKETNQCVLLQPEKDLPEGSRIS